MTWQPAPVVQQDAEMWACEYLRARLATRLEAYASNVYVDIKIPNARRTRMVIVRRDGGQAIDTIDQPRFGIRIFAATEKDAADLGGLIAALWRDAPNAGEAAWTDVIAGPYVVDDPSASPLRYLITAAALRGTDLT